ncbi:MAG TPA: hypothetical protein VM820_16835 [Vicinamibacterales bacterium]|nr:hypothetical protein [Vicinamibacterales bacterium]
MSRSSFRTVALVGVVILVLGGVFLYRWWLTPDPGVGRTLDEALKASPPRAAASFPAADEDYFRDMDQTRDGPIALSPDEVKGRNTWVVWSAGNDVMWDTLGDNSVGALDFLKVLSSHPSQKYSRACDPARLADGRCQNRWEYFGLVNEPCFEKPTGPDPNRMGLWLDQRKAGCAPDPFENAAKYPGVRFGSRGGTINGKPFETGSYYGYATGIVGFRLFPNPEFDEAAAERWDVERYYTDPTYYNAKTLVRPYRVGMSCGLCHVGPNPIKPPADPNNPEWANLSSNVGAQYFWTDRIFYEAADYSSFAFQLFHSSRPGSLDTSFVSTDNINNPRTMNAVYGLLPRLLHAKRWGKETLAGGGLNNRQLNDYVKAGPLATLFTAPDTVWTPRVLKDGSDSVGVMGALNRVYLNIGTFSEEWLKHFNPLVGGKPITPIEISVAREHSAMYAATEAQTFDVARFFLKTTEPHKLADAPGGAAFLTTDQRVLTRGKVVFAENCARCHSSKVPEMATSLIPDGCVGKDYLSCWNKYWEATETPQFKAEMTKIVTAADFLDGNYLSTELRVPVTLLGTNACSPLATNALADNIWDNFSSQSYKDLPSVGDITWYHPYSGEARTYTMPAGGRGYTRPASLISMWSTAPYLLNNAVGRFESSPSLEARMRSFDDSIRQMLWPERRDKDSLLGDRIPGVIDRVGDRAPAGYDGGPAYVTVPAGYLPEFLQRTLGEQRARFPALFTDEGVRLGPIPQGTPIGLLANLNLLSENRDAAARARQFERVSSLLVGLLERLHKLGGNATNEQARAAFADMVDPLLELSKCPDLVINRGHEFGVKLSDQDKNALIELLKTF